MKKTERSLFINFQLLDFYLLCVHNIFPILIFLYQYFCIIFYILNLFLNLFYTALHKNTPICNCSASITNCKFRIHEIKNRLVILMIIINNDSVLSLSDIAYESYKYTHFKLSYFNVQASSYVYSSMHHLIIWQSE